MAILVGINGMAPGTIQGNVTVNGNLTMASGKQILIDDGTLAAPGLAIASVPSTGLYKNGTGFGLGATGTAAIATTSSVVELKRATTCESIMTINSGLRVDSETVKTISYQVTSSDNLVVMNGTTLTATLPATPGTSQRLTVKNIDAGNCTIARNGKTIDGGTSDITLATMEAADLHYDGTGWYRLNNIP